MDMIWQWQHTRKLSSTLVESRCSTCLCIARACRSCSRNSLQHRWPATSSLIQLATGSHQPHTRHLSISLTIDNTDRLSLMWSKYKVTIHPGFSMTVLPEGRGLISGPCPGFHGVLDLSSIWNPQNLISWFSAKSLKSLPPGVRF